VGVAVPVAEAASYAIGGSEKRRKSIDHSTFGGSEARTEPKIGAVLLHGCLHFEKIKYLPQRARRLQVPNISI